MSLPKTVHAIWTGVFQATKNSLSDILHHSFKICIFVTSVIFGLISPQVIEGTFINLGVILSNVCLTEHKQFRLMSLASDGNKLLNTFLNTICNRVQGEQHNNQLIKTHTNAINI